MPQDLERTKLFVSRTIRTLNWRLDVETPEMIEQITNGMQYCKDHLSQPGAISQQDLNSICEIVNTTFQQADSLLRVSNSMGEFIPAKAKGNPQVWDKSCPYICSTGCDHTDWLHSSAYEDNVAHCYEPECPLLK